LKVQRVCMKMLFLKEVSKTVKTKDLDKKMAGIDSQSIVLIYPDPKRAGY